METAPAVKNLGTELHRLHTVFNADRLSLGWSPLPDVDVWVADKLWLLLELKPTEGSSVYVGRENDQGQELQSIVCVHNGGLVELYNKWQPALSIYLWRLRWV